MESKKRIGMFVFLSLLFCSLLSAQELAKEGKYWVGKIHKNYKVNQGGNLVIQEITGDITVRVWDKSEVDITEIKRMDIFSKSEAEAAMKETEGSYTQKGNDILIGGLAFDRSWIQCSFTIYLPVEFNCDLQSKGGGLSVTGLKGTVNGRTGGGKISLRTIGGPATVRSGGGSIEIMETTGEVNARTGGGSIEIISSAGAVSASTGGGSMLIEKTGDVVNASTGGGEVTVRGTKGSVTVKTGGGALEITDAGGDVTANTGGGEIDITNVNGNFSAKTGGGDVHARKVMGTLDVSTGGGDVRAQEVSGSIEINTGGGEIEADLAMTDFSKSFSVRMNTGGGDIELRMPEKIHASISAMIKYSKRGWEEYEITSDFPLKITKQEEGKYKIIEATGDINGGGNPVELRTGGGDIRILKSLQ